MKFQINKIFDLNFTNFFLSNSFTIFIFSELLYLFPIRNLFVQIYFSFTFVFSSICKYLYKLLNCHFSSDSSAKFLQYVFSYYRLSWVSSQFCFSFSVSDSQHTHTNMNTLTNRRIFHQIHAIFSLISVISNHSIFFLVQHFLSRRISCFSWTRLSDFVRDHPIILRFFLPSIMELSSSSSWLVMLSWILAHLLWTLLTWIFDQSGASRNLLHSTTILLIIPRKFSLSMKHGSNQLTLTILFHLWHLLVIQSCTLLVSLVTVVVLLSFFDQTWNSNFSALATYLHLNLSNLFIYFINSSHHV